MRYRLMATYRGVSYEAGMGPTDADVVLFASSPPPGEPGFEPAAGYWHKRISREKLDAIWEARPIGRYRSEPCLVLEEIGHRLHITYLGHDGYRAKRLGYWQVDRGVYEVIVPRDEVTELSEARVDYPVHLHPDAALPDAVLPDAVLPDVLPDHEATTSHGTPAAAEAAPAPERGRPGAHSKRQTIRRATGAATVARIGAATAAGTERRLGAAEARKVPRDTPCAAGATPGP